MTVLVVLLSSDGGAYLLGVSRRVPGIDNFILFARQGRVAFERGANRIGREQSSTNAIRSYDLGLTLVPDGILSS